MRADWSRPDPRIAAYLQGFECFGIPFDVVDRPDRLAGEQLPELLTPAILLASLDRVSGNWGPAAVNTEVEDAALMPNMAGQK